MIDFVLSHYSVSFATRSCEFQTCVALVTFLTAHLVNVYVDDVDTVSVAVDINRPYWIQVYIASGSRLWILKWSAQISEVEIAVYQGWCR